MQIVINLQATGQEVAIALGFNIHEIKFALAVLKGIQNVVKADFIQEAIDDLEEFMKPKALPFINYFHICSHCKMDLDERNDNTMRISKDDDVTWQHRQCPVLKKDRPR